MPVVNAQPHPRTTAYPALLRSVQIKADVAAMAFLKDFLFCYGKSATAASGQAPTADNYPPMANGKPPAADS